MEWQQYTYIYNCNNTGMWRVVILKTCPLLVSCRLRESMAYTNATCLSTESHHAALLYCRYYYVYLQNHITQHCCTVTTIMSIYRITPHSTVVLSLLLCLSTESHHHAALLYCRYYYVYLQNHTITQHCCTVATIMLLKNHNIYHQRQEAG